MHNETELRETATVREDMYRFLSRLYLLEADRELLSVLTVMDFPKECLDGELTMGYRLMEKAVRDTSEDLDELAADYARVFLAAGVAQGNAAFPYESVYTSRRCIVNQNSKVQAAALYAEEGMSMAPGLPGIPEDHVAAELDFMAHLCGESQLDPAYYRRQKGFFKEHIQNWVPRLAMDVAKYARTDFYKALAAITTGFVRMEYQYLLLMDTETIERAARAAHAN